MPVFTFTHKKVGLSIICAVRLVMGSLYQPSLLFMCDNQQPIKSKLHSAKWSKYRVRLLTVLLLKWSRSNICYFGHSNPLLID